VSEVGSVDLSGLKDMPHLKGFFCGYVDNVKNSDAISYPINLEELTLIDVTVDNLDFLNVMSDTIVLTLCLPRMMIVTTSIADKDLCQTKIIASIPLLRRRNGMRKAKSRSA